MPPPLDPAKRAAILEAIRAGGKSQRQIAADHDVSTTAVRKIANQAGITDAWSREQTKNATEARLADNKALRAEVSRRFLEKSRELLDQMDQPHLVFNFGGKDNDYNERVLDRPPTGDLRNLMISAATALDKHLVAERHDADTGAAGARSVLGQLAAGLQLAAEQIDGTPPDDPEQ